MNAASDAAPEDGRPALDLVEERVEVAGHVFNLLRPRDLDALIDEESFRHDEFIPYWAELWPSGLAMAEALPPGRALTGRRVLELGCGLGLPSLVSACRGAVVTAVDWSPDAVAVLRRNARRQSLSLTIELANWGDQEWFAEHGPWDLVLAADVLYERRHLEPLLRLLPDLGREVWLADPGRPAFGDFLEAAQDQWKLDDVAPSVVRLLRRNNRSD